METNRSAPQRTYSKMNEPYDSILLGNSGSRDPTLLGINMVTWGEITFTNLPETQSSSFFFVTLRIQTVWTPSNLFCSLINSDA